MRLASHLQKLMNIQLLWQVECDPRWLPFEQFSIETIKEIQSVGYSHVFKYQSNADIVLIADPDRSNPTRSRWERPLDTIRSFEAAIDGNYRKSYIRSGQTSLSFNGSPTLHGKNADYLDVQNQMAHQITTAGAVILEVGFQFHMFTPLNSFSIRPALAPTSFLRVHSYLVLELAELLRKPLGPLRVALWQSQNSMDVVVCSQLVR